MTTPEKKISAFTPLYAIAEDGVVVANQTVTGPTGGLPIPALRTRLNTGAQSFTADVDVAGKVSANQLEGNGALISGVVSAGTGGTSSTGSLQLVANSDNSTPAAKVQLSKYSTLLADLDETGLELKTGIPYSHADSYAPFDKGIDLFNNRMIRNQTIEDQTTEPFFHCDGVAGKLSFTDYTLDFNAGAFLVFRYRKVAAGAAPLIGKSGTVGYSNLVFDASERLRGETDTDSDIFVNATLTYDSDIHKLVITGTGKTVYTYRDGKLIDTKTVADGNVTLNSIALSGVTYGNIEYFGRAFGNRALTESEAIKHSSNPQAAFTFADEGGSNTNIVTSGVDRNFGTDVADRTAFDAAYTWLTSATITCSVSSNVYTASGAVNTLGLLGWSGLTGGKRYRFIINVSALSNSVVLTDSTLTVLSTISSTGLKIIDFLLPTGQTTIYLRPAASVATSISIDASATDNNINRLGATAVYKGRDFQEDFAFDSSGNNFNDTVSGATLCNKSRVQTPKKGTLQATLTCGTSGTITLNTSFDTLNWRREGGMTDVWGQIKVTSVSSPVGRLILGGIPYNFTDTAETSELAAGSVTTQTLASAATAGLGFIVNAGTKTIDICDGFNGTGAVGNDFAAHIQANTTITVFFRYYTLDAM